MIMEQQYNDMQMLKRSMYAMRNGIVADALRKGGCPHKMVFGVNLPQLADIAHDFGINREVAEQLWADTSTRESMLLAPMLMPAEEFSTDDAMRWIDSCPSREAIDILCLKLLRLRPFALDLARELSDDANSMRHYAGMRLMCNLAPQHPALAVEMGRKEMECGCEKQLAQILLSYSDLDE